MSLFKFNIFFTIFSVKIQVYQHMAYIMLIKYRKYRNIFS